MAFPLLRKYVSIAFSTVRPEGGEGLREPVRAIGGTARWVMTRRPETRETRRQAPHIPPPLWPRPQGEEAGHRPAGRSRPVLAPAGRLSTRPGDERGGRRGSAARRQRTGSPVGGRPVGKAQSGENGMGKTGRAGQRRRRDLGTATADSRRLRGWPQASGHRFSNSGHHAPYHGARVVTAESEAGLISSDPALVLLLEAELRPQPGRDAHEVYVQIGDTTLSAPSGYLINSQGMERNVPPAGHGLLLNCRSRTGAQHVYTPNSSFLQPSNLAKIHIPFACLAFSFQCG